MSTTIKTSNFVRRQTPDSKFAHFEGSWEDLESLVLENLGEAQPGYRDGVVLVPVPPNKFKSSVVKVTSDTHLWASLEARQNQETPVITVVARGVPKTPAVAVDVVIYRADVLAEDNDRSTDADWEIVSVNARVTEEPEPMDPVTMARNFLRLAGGTKGSFTAEEFAKAIMFWATHCKAG